MHRYLAVGLVLIVAGHWTADIVGLRGLAARSCHDEGNRHRVTLHVTAQVPGGRFCIDRRRPLDGKGGGSVRPHGALVGNLYFC